MASALTLAEVEAFASLLQSFSTRLCRQGFLQFHIELWGLGGGLGLTLAGRTSNSLRELERCGRGRKCPFFSPFPVQAMLVVELRIRSLRFHGRTDSHTRPTHHPPSSLTCRHFFDIHLCFFCKPTHIIAHKNAGDTRKMRRATGGVRRGRGTRGVHHDDDDDDDDAAASKP